MSTVVLKCFLEMPDLSVETRRFVLERVHVDKDGIYDQVHGKIRNTFPDLESKKFSLFWKDDDEDFVTMSTDEEIRDLLSNEGTGVCRIYIKVNGDEDSQSNKSEHGDGDGDSLAKGKGDHNKSDPWMEMPPPHPGPFGSEFSAFPHAPPPPPPFSFHGQHPHRPFGGSWGRGRGGGPHHHPHGFGHHFPHRRMHHWHPHGAGGHHPHWGHHWGHHWGGHGHGGKHGGKDSLRNMVPVPHRRWAKGFIQSWRKENLKNATTTTSDSDGKVDWKISMADAGVPQAYAGWLKLKLVRWHKKWSSDDINEMEVEGEHKQMEKVNKGLKASVPKEFRQWTKRYLNTHFCRRDAPKFKRHHNGWKQDFMENKKHFLYAMVPREYRLWTKKFIRVWRIEKKLDDPSSHEPLPNSSEDNGTDMDTNEMVSIPEEYKQWLDKFLIRWHTWRGQLERNPDVELKRGQFKDGVPMEYRTWVKHYLCVHYSKYNKHFREVNVDPSQAKYEKILQAFQKKWMDNQKSLGIDHDILLYMSSSDEETNQGEPESSFKRLSLSNDNGSKKTKVRFDDPSDLGKAKKQKTVKMADLALLMDSDDYDDDNDNDDGRAQQGKVPMNPSFRHWTKQALYNWDGETVGEANNSQRDGDEETKLPPNVYQWMSKMMMKMQKKKMKHQFKAAKREMKAVKRELKHGNN